MIAKKLNPKLASMKYTHTMTLRTITTTHQKSNTITEEKPETNIRENYILLAKTPKNENMNEENQQANRTLQISTTAVIVNKRITTPVTLENRPKHGSSYLNIVQAHRNIFISMKKKDFSLKLITETQIIDTELQLSHEE